MSQEINNVLPLDFSKSVKPTGSAWVVDYSNPATVPLPLQTTVVKVDGPYTEKDRKLWNFLVHAFWDELDENGVYSVDVDELNKVFTELGGDVNTNWIWESAKRLTRSTVEWKITFDDGRFEDGISSMFGAKVTTAAKKTRKLTFFFPRFLVPILKDPSRWGRIRTHFLISLSGKYSVSLYEMLENFINLKKGEVRLTIQEFREWLNVPDNTYKEWKSLKRWVIDPSFKQVNGNPDFSGLHADYFISGKSGKSYTHITITVKKTDKRKSLEKIYRRSRQLKTKAKENNRPHLKPSTFEKARKASNFGLDIYDIEDQFWEEWERTGRPTFDKGFDATFIGFARKKAKDAGLI